MRRAHHVRQAEQAALRRRFFPENVDRGAGDVAGFERLAQRRLVNELTARTVDQPHAFFGQLQRLGVDDVAGLVGQRRVQGDEIGAPPQLVELDLFDAELDRALGRQIRVVGDHLHLQPDRPVGDDRTDIAAADDAERL